MKLRRGLPSRASELLAIPVLLALFAGQFLPLLTEQLNLAGFQDNVFLLAPLFHHVSAVFRHGEYPYWMETIVAGLPLYDTPQFSLAYPFYFFGLADYSDALRTMLSLHRIALLHLAILHWTGYAMFRLLRYRVWPSVFGASLLAFSPNMVDFAGWTNAIAPYAWLPLVIAGVVLVAEGERAGLGIVVGGVALALLTLAMPAHALIHAIFVGVVIQAARAAGQWRLGEGRRALASTWRLVVMGLLALVLSAPGVLPAALDQGRMIRFGAAEGGSVPFEDFLVGQLEPVQLAATLLPYDVPVVTGRSFVGLGAVFFALLGLRDLSRRWYLMPAAGLAAYGLLSATGQHLGLAQINHLVPLINMIREPPRHLILFVIFGSMLAASGIESLDAFLRDGRRRPDRGHWWAVGVFGLLVLAAFQAPLEYRPEIVKTRYFVLCAVPFGLTALAFLLGRRLGRVALWLAGLAVLVGNMQYPMDVGLMRDSDYFKAENRASHEALRELATLPDARDYRVSFEGGALNRQFWAMNASYYGLRSFEAYMNPLPRRQFEEVFGQEGLHHYYPLLGGKYHVCHTCEGLEALGYRRLRALGSESLYANDSALPRYAVLSRIAGTYKDAGEFYNAVAAGFDSRDAAWLEASEKDAVSRWLGPPAPGPPHVVVTETVRTANLTRVEVTSDRPAVLLLNEYYTSNWKARAGGASVPIHRINLNQVGVLIGSGSSQVEFEYRPTLFVALLWLQRLGWLALGLGLAGWTWTARGGRSREAPVE